jgi:hypothetical protein
MSGRFGITAVLLAVSTTLAGCGDGGGVASAPTPAIGQPGTAETRTYAISTESDIGAELPPTPATTPGSYDTIAVGNLKRAGDSQPTAGDLGVGQVALIVDADRKTYTIVFAPNVVPGLPAGENRLSYIADDPRYNHLVTETVHWSDGTTSTSTAPHASAIVGRRDTSGGSTVESDFWALTANEKRYVSLGLWRLLDSPNKDSAAIYFVYGDRTPPANIPVSGTATYVTGNRVGDFLEYGTIAYYDVDVDISLTADFAKRSMSAKMSLAFQDDLIKSFVRPSLSGTGPIAPAGSFAIPLTGVMDYTAAKPDPVTGSISGALFGPDASQIGATFSLLHSGEPPITGAFIGIRQ